MADPMSTTSDTPSVDLRTLVQFLPGVGPGRAKRFERLGILTVADLLKHVPHRYEFEHAETPLAELGVDQLVSARGEISQTRVSGFGRKQRFEALIVDDHGGRLPLIWFNSSFLRNKLHPGMQIRVQGKTKKRGPELQMANPKWEIIDEDAASRDERYKPVYPATEDLPSDRIDETIQSILEQTLPLIEEHLPEAYRTQRELPLLSTAYRMMHRPETEDEVQMARRRLAFDELLMLQLGVAMRRFQLREQSEAVALPWSDTIHSHILERFPFPLTPAQDKVISEIRADLTTSIPMNRLLQGDVGAGKTVVALYAMLMAVVNRQQSVLMAPTEILAEQHFMSISDMLKESSVRIALLTGTLTASERQSVLGRAASGDLDIVIGTHALLSDKVDFKRLAVAVIDEQHRFGVEQRATLRERGEATRGLVPHTLIMTATPIPRTLSITLFGDLDVSVIHGLPPGRSPVVTRVVGDDKVLDVYGYVAERLRNGEQAYVVLPAIDDSTSGGLKDVRSRAKWLEEGPLSEFRIATMHGRLKRDSRARIMERFRQQKIDILVATTVIEVGVDVPNASVMIVEHAERFGLSQLHQLRGRVGRGDRKSLCVFIGDPTTDDAQKRLDAIAATTDGFAIAEADFEIRGMGEIFGTRQSGVAPFNVASLPRDMELLNLARRDAREWIADDPELAAADHTLLRQRLMKRFGESLGIGDVG